MFRKSLSFAVLICVGLLLAGLSLPSRSQILRRPIRQPLSDKDRPRSAPDKILVKYKKMGDVRTQESMKASIESSFGIQEIKKFTLIEVSVYRTFWDKEQTLVELNANPFVEYAEPDYYRYSKSTFPNDLRFFDLWGLHNTGQNSGIVDADIDAPQAWDLTTGSPDVVVAVIDSGVDYNHEDLKTNMWRNPGEIPGNEIDDDDNGYIDDYHGIDAINKSGDPMDDDGHGTHASGSIAAVGNNGIGITGVCWNCRIMALRFLSREGGGTISDEVECIQYAVNQGVKIISGSFGEYDFSQSEKNAIDAAGNSGVLFVFAVGNDGENNDIKPHYPSAHDSENIISVGVSNRNDQLVSWSDYGLTTVDVAAPGDDILSTVLNNGYQTESGTSMATPHVAGLAALIKSYNPSLNWLDIKNLILDNGDKIPSALGKIVSGSRINAYKALMGEKKIVLNLQAGAGGTTSPPPGIYNHEEIESVSIFALPDPDFEFSYWTGSVSSGQVTDNPLILQMDSSKMIKANFRSLLFAPIHFEGERIENRSLSQRESIIVLKWQANPNNPDIEIYRLYEISESSWFKLAELDASVFTYVHRRVELNKPYSYALVVVSKADSEGPPTYFIVDEPCPF
ncbi:S8 family serine peptidase [Acidobacteriota bacterium]